MHTDGSICDSCMARFIQTEAAFWEHKQISQHHFVFLYLQPVHVFAETKATATTVDDSVASSLSLPLTPLCCPLLLLLVVCLHHKSFCLMLHVFLSVWCISVAALQLRLQASHIYYNVNQQLAFLFLNNVFVFLWTRSKCQCTTGFWTGNFSKL